MRDLTDLQSELYDLTLSASNIVFKHKETKNLLNKLEKTEKRLIAVEKKKYEGSDANKTSQALASEEYKDFLLKWTNISNIESKDSAEYMILQMKFDALRTLISSMSKERF